MCSGSWSRRKVRVARVGRSMIEIVSSAVLLATSLSTTSEIAT